MHEVNANVYIFGYICCIANNNHRCISILPRNFRLHTRLAKSFIEDWRHVIADCASLLRKKAISANFVCKTRKKYRSVRQLITCGITPDFIPIRSGTQDILIGFLVVFFRPSRKIPGQYFLPNLSFINHHNNRSYIVWIRKAPLRNA
jgi:hypothetical protein